MKNNPIDGLRIIKTFQVENETNPGRNASSPHWHSIVLSSLSSNYAGDTAALEQSFKELMRYYRHSSVGQRCLGIVHQMNTPLQVLSLQLDLLEQKAQDELELLSTSFQNKLKKLESLYHYRQEKYHQLRYEIEKLQNFTLSLANQGMHEDGQEKTHLDLNQVCRQELELYLTDPFFKHQINREFHFGEGVSEIYGHYIDFSQSFRNLIDNALEAMEGIEHPHLTVITTCQERSFTVRIGDTGAGISANHLPRIFEPFFTTKRTVGGVRAGLGLFMVRRLLASYEAEIRIDSIPGETWVTVSIPLV